MVVETGCMHQACIWYDHLNAKCMYKDLRQHWYQDFLSNYCPVQAFPSLLYSTMTSLQISVKSLTLPVGISGSVQTLRNVFPARALLARADAVLATRAADPVSLCLSCQILPSTCK